MYITIYLLCATSSCCCISCDAQACGCICSYFFLNLGPFPAFFSSQHFMVGTYSRKHFKIFHPMGRGQISLQIVEVRSWWCWANADKYLWFTPKKITVQSVSPPNSFAINLHWIWSWLQYGYSERIPDLIESWIGGVLNVGGSEHIPKVNITCCKRIICNWHY